MRKKILTIFVMLIPNMIYSQHLEQTQQDIEYSVVTFFSYISAMNDPFEPIPISVIVGKYGSQGNYFHFNENSTTLKQFLDTYLNKYLKSRVITHELTKIKINKTSSDQNDKRYSIKAILKRSSSTGEDIIIPDTELEMTVLWDDKCSILELKLNPELNISYPRTRDKYIFEVDRSKSKTRVSYEGGDWYIKVNSRKRTLKEYPGYPDKTITLQDVPWDWEYSIATTEVKSENTKDMVRGYLGENFSKNEKSFTINLKQNTSDKKLSINIFQYARPSVIEEIFDLDDISNHNISLGYSLKYQIGLSYMYTFYDSRFLIGALIHTNTNSFKGWKTKWNAFTDYSYYVQEGAFVELNTTDKKSYSYTYNSNGYKITVDHVEPSDEYSPLFDPHNAAEINTARSLYMVQSGVYITNWARFELGIGIATKKDKYYLDNVYKYELTTYTPLSNDYPPIESTYSYSWYKSNYYLNGRPAANFAIRTGVNFFIPQKYDWHINLGIGYVTVPTDLSCNSLDFQFGFGWYF